MGRMPVDYRALLVKYMSIVHDDYGTALPSLPKRGEWFTDAEWEELQSLAAEVASASPK
jgi:hypothetical protein